jgi:hypothetical protein
MANGASLTVLARGPDAAPAEGARSGLPHWIVVDEAHYFFGAGGASSADAVVQTGNTVLVTYRPSLIAPDLRDSIGAFILTQTTVAQKRYFVDALLRARGPAELDVSGGAPRAGVPARGALVARPRRTPVADLRAEAPPVRAHGSHPARRDRRIAAREGILLPPSR